MDTEQLDRILRHTLQDAKMSRGEKRVLRQVLREAGVEDRDLPVLRSRAFAIAREQLGPTEEATLDWLEDAVRIFSETVESPEIRSSEVYFTPGDNGPRKIINLLAFCRKSADICVFTITDDRITEGIIEAHDRGVSIRVISDNDKAMDIGSDISRLRSRGVPVRTDLTEDHMHHKFAIFDNATTLTGSYNWTRSAADRNAENFILAFDPALAAQFSAEFNRLWKSFA